MYSYVNNTKLFVGNYFGSTECMYGNLPPYGITTCLHYSLESDAKMEEVFIFTDRKCGEVLGSA